MGSGKKKARDRWFKEWFTPYESHSHKLKKIIVKKKTKFQNALIADTYSFGRCLVLDGEMQSAQLDEFIYHESLVHPSFIAHPDPAHAVILGGGEGATLREILKHKSIRRASMIDIDGEVVEWCRNHMSLWHQGSFDNPRARIIIGDAKQFIRETGEKFDIIVSDLPSPIEAGPAFQLYTVEFYRILKTRLKPGGSFVLQAGSGNLLQIALHLRLYRTLKKVFSIVRSYSAHVPSFDVPWSFLSCTDNTKADPAHLSAKEVERRIFQRVSGALQFYDGIAHEGLFRTPKHLRERLAKEKRIITLKKPLYFFK
jgi:spermidine synthase